MRAMADRYDELYRQFRWNVPVRYNIAQACCGQWAADRSRFALYWEDESGAAAAFSFWDIQQQANRLSNALAALGVKSGDRVALLLPQRPESAIAYMAIFQMGAVALPLSHLFGPDALEYRMEHAGASVAIVEPTTIANLWAVRGKLSQLRHVIGVGGAREAGVHPWETLLAKASAHFPLVDTAADDPALIIYTSGTTGAAQGRLRGASPAHRQSQRLRALARLLSAARRYLLVAGGLGLGGRALRRAAAFLGLRHPDPRLPRQVRRGKGLLPAGTSTACATRSCFPPRSS